MTSEGIDPAKQEVSARDESAELRRLAGDIAETCFTVFTETYGIGTVHERTENAKSAIDRTVDRQPDSKFANVPRDTIRQAAYDLLDQKIANLLAGQEKNRKKTRAAKKALS